MIKNKMESKLNLNAIINNILCKYNTLLDCPVKFCGDYGGQKIQQFIEYIESYKKIKSISDEQALGELGYLLTEHAHSWWQRRKSHFTTWSEALTALHNQYGRQRPAFLVYKDIFEHKYEDYAMETEFIDDKYELLTELSDPKQSEKNKFDMIFALLPKEVQTKLEYGSITSVSELRQEILKLKLKESNETNVTTANSSENSNLVNGVHDIEPKEENISCVSQTDTVQKDIDPNECGEVVPATTCIVNDKDPVIKVRRTEDLMPPLVKKESNNEDDTTMAGPQEEFIAINQTSTTHDNVNFQIDIDIMDQINTIIDESEMNCESNHSGHNSPIMSVQESSSPTVGFLLNGETTIHAEVSKKPHPAVSAGGRPTIRKMKLRCTYCRKYNHIAQDCIKRTRHMQLFPEKFLPTSKISGDEIKGNKEISSKSNNDVNVLPLSNESTSTAYSTSNAFTNVPTSLTYTVTSTATMVSPTITTTVAATSIPTVTQNNVSMSQATSHITIMTSNPPTPTASLTTKLIAPINGPCPSKLLAAKLRNSNTPSSRCHQCGTAGFYKSICPNCSPIYNCNQQYK
ncbi:uncharacterized protein LOC101894850 [Musca domestica]|uniref:Uncharacterized protein LOC101894850 n=1 Tax=Musca domestica TaxID=7370 RepID=A0ABM3UTD6_MUSDO|nr:uncharacterized protein LOC101894850 [Musca domestica]XP_058976786.1 uncharacterized protein LOC101894850 [Musca domestica]XP_058976787.1 uncharacterized protein LOC101894850 [Musca domestica]